MSPQYEYCFIAMPANRDRLFIGEPESCPSEERIHVFQDYCFRHGGGTVAISRRPIGGSDADWEEFHRMSCEDEKITIGDHEYTLLRLKGYVGGGTVWDARRENGTLVELTLDAQRFSRWTEPMRPAKGGA